MTEPWSIPDPGVDPTPELLAAYADGELEPRVRQQVEAWLRDRPGAGAEVEALRGLKRVWQTLPAPEPAPEAWNTTLARIEARLPRPGVRPRPSRGRWMAWTWVLSTSAAAVLLVVLSRLFWPGLLPLGGEGEEVPFPVTAGSEVVIISMDANDVAALVVGHPPVQGEIVLTSHDEIALLDWGTADFHPNEGGAPMVVDPQAMPGLR